MALNYELTTLHNIVEKKIDPRIIATKNIDEGFYKAVQEQTTNEVERIKFVLRERMMNIKKEHQKKEYILQHQVNIVRLADKVYEYLLPKNKNALYTGSKVFEPANVYKDVFIAIEQLLQFVAEDFPVYFDKSMKVPETWRWLLELEVEDKLQHIRNDLKNHGVDENLIEVACMPLASVLTGGDMSYEAHDFLQLFLKKVSNFHNADTCRNATEKFLKVLWRINFNSVWLYNYSVVEYDRFIKDSKTVSEAICFLQMQEKILKQIPARTDIAYRTEQPSIVVMLQGWIREELLLLREEQAQVKLMKKLGKIMTVLSVEELGYSCRLLHDQGLFPDIEEGEFLEIAASSFITPKSKDISVDSIKNKSNKPGPNAKQRVKGYLYEMARMIR